MSSRRFTDEQFNKMVDELLDPNGSSLTTFSEIYELTIHYWLVKECSGNSLLNHSDTIADLSSELYLKFATKIVPNFLLREGVDKVNRDPDGFYSWMFAVARNFYIDKSVQATKKAKLVTGDENIDKGISSSLSIGGYSVKSDFYNEILEASFRVVLNTSTKPYIALAWVAMSVLVIRFNDDKRKINPGVLKAFYDKPLSEMYSDLKACSMSITWLYRVLCEDCTLLKKLNEVAPNGDGRLYGEMPFSSFFGNAKEPLAQLADWQYRMDAKINKAGLVVSDDSSKKSDSKKNNTDTDNSKKDDEDGKNEASN